MQLINLLYILCGAGAAGLLGMDVGRRGERAKLLSPVVRGSGERRWGDWEDQLRKSMGAPRMHPDPANAAHQRQLRIRR